MIVVPARVAALGAAERPPGVMYVEDWELWQIQADEIAAGLSREVDALESDFFGDNADETFRAFWPRFRALKDKVRTAPAIRLEPKMELERRLRAAGARAYKAQEGAYIRSQQRKEELLPRIEGIRTLVEAEENPRVVREIRRDLEAIRESFDAGTPLVPADRQAAWQAWNAVNQLLWRRLNALWAENETFLRGILESGREALAGQNPNAVQNAVSRFYEGLRSHETRQALVNDMKREAEELRSQAEEVRLEPAERRPSKSAVPALAAPYVPPVDNWRSELERNQELMNRLSGELADLEERVEGSQSILEQAMLRGNIVDKRRKLTDLERSNRSLSQRLDQVEDTPLIPSLS